MNTYKAKIMLVQAMKRYAREADPEAFANVVGKIISSIDSSALKDVIEFAMRKMQIDDIKGLEEGYTIFARKMYQKELLAAKHKIAEDIIKILDVNKEQLDPELNNTKGSFNSKTMKKQANLSAIWDRVKQMSPMELTKNAINFASGFDDMRQVASQIMKVVNDINSNPPVPPSGMAATAGIGSAIGKVTGLMMLISIIATVGAAGTSDLVSATPPGATEAEEIKAIAAAVGSWGLTGILSFLENLFKRKENKG